MRKSKVKNRPKPRTDEEAIAYIRDYCNERDLSCVWIEHINNPDNITFEMRRGRHTFRYTMTQEKKEEISYGSFFKLIKKMERKIEEFEEEDLESEDWEDEM